MSDPTCASLFSGDGMLDFGLHLAGWEHVFFCEREADRREILSLRWPGVPIYEDVRDVDGAAPGCDLLAFGFPCRGASTAGDRTGLDHPETSLWREAARVIRLLRPRLVLIENVANLLSVPTDDRGRAWGEVLGDLVSFGYVGAWDCLPAAAFGAPHLRDRVFAVAADASSIGQRAPDHEANARSGGRDARQVPVGGDRRSFAPADAERNGVRKQPKPESRRSRSSEPARPDQDAAHPGQGRRQASPSVNGSEPAQPSPHADGFGLPVEWAEYELAICRWEEAFEPAPEPLLCGVDARDARRVVKSRLSALGDGVQLQAAQYIGARMMEVAHEWGIA